MPKYRMGNGLNVTPDKDLKMFKEMSADGYHLSGTKWGGSTWEFTEGEPCDYEYAINYKDHLDDEELEYYHSAGWDLIIDYPGIQVFRGEPGCEPIYAGYDSYDSMLEDQELVQGRTALYMGIMFVLLMVLAYANQSHPLWIWLPAMFVLLIFLINFIPFMGMHDTIKKRSHQQSDDENFDSF